MKTFKQYLQEALDVTNNPNFWKWFGDSKVVDESGKPLVVYHGTNNNFNEFDVSLLNKNYTPVHGSGFYFAQRYMLASEHGKNVISVYLSIHNPLESNLLNLEKVNQLNIRLDEYAKQNGYDGIVYAPRDSEKQYVAFYPTQIKSATGNNGDFDPNNPDITK
jgi:hypothetical protein